MTLSEISVMGKPSVLIPSPNVTNDQQTKNARLLSDKGAAVLLKESELSENRLSDEVARLLSSGKELENMGMAAKGFAVRNAEETIFRKIAEVVEEKKKRKK